MNGKEPLVLCLTNTVAANFTANCLLAIGAKPAMVEEASEAAELAPAAEALLVNLGTVTERQADVMRAAIAAANAHGTPWVLDPVAVQTLAFRRRLAVEFLSLGPALVRGNHAEVEALLKSVPRDTLQTILSTGEVDAIRNCSHPDSHSPLSVSGGTPLLTSVTATGCAQGAVCAAFLGWGRSPEEAALSASKLMKTAGERAAARFQTPGAFQSALLDELWNLTHQP